MSDESELQRALTDAIALRPGDELFGHTLKAKGVSMDCFGWWMSDGGFATLPNIIGYLRAHPKEAKAPSSGIAPPGSVPIASVRQAKTRKNPMGSSRKRHGWQARLARARRLANRNFATVFTAALAPYLEALEVAREALENVGEYADMAAAYDASKELNLIAGAASAAIARIAALTPDETPE